MPYEADSKLRIVECKSGANDETVVMANSFRPCLGAARDEKLLFLRKQPFRVIIRYTEQKARAVNLSADNRLDALWA